MGEAKRRRDSGDLAGLPIKLPPRKMLDGFRLVHHRRLEETDAEGMVYARHVFVVVTPDGQMMAEETPEGPKPVLLTSVRQPIRRSIVASGLVRG